MDIIEPSKLAEPLQRISLRRTLLFCSIFISIIGYLFVVDFYDSNMDVVRQVWRGIVQQRYTLYTGKPGGFYIQIGKHMEKETESGTGIKVNNKETNGGFENATKVMNKSSSFGLVQEDTLRENDYLRKHIRYITPLYLEQMHILYDYDTYLEITGQKEYLEITKQKENSGLLILARDNKNIETFFEKARVSTGPHGSGSKIFASFLLSQLGIGNVTDESLSFKEGLEKLADKEIDVVFCIAGAPLSYVTNILTEHKGNIKLMSIDPVFFKELNEEFGLRLRPTTFKNCYEGGEKISTIGSHAFLIASNDVPNSAILEFLTILDQSKRMMPGYTENFQLDQFDFLAAFQKEHEGFTMTLLRNLFVFIVSVVITSAGAMLFLVWLVSGYKRVAYIRKITDVYSMYLPENITLNEKDNTFPVPVIYNDQGVIIDKLVKGVSHLLDLARKIRQDHETGGITITDHTHLMGNLYLIRDIFQRNLGQRLNEVLETKDLMSPASLRHYYTAGYLKREDYRDLVQTLNLKIAKIRGTIGMGKVENDDQKLLPP